MWCFFGFHVWGRQFNVREKKMPDAAFFFVPVLFAYVLCPPRECDRTCVKCGKTKTFPYDAAIGT